MSEKNLVMGSKMTQDKEEKRRNQRECFRQLALDHQNTSEYSLLKSKSVPKIREFEKAQRYQRALNEYLEKQEVKLPIMQANCNQDRH